MKISDLREKINEFGAKKQAFLFAVDFEMSQCIWVEDPLKQDRILFKTPLCSNLGIQRKADYLLQSRHKDKSLTSYPEPLSIYEKKYQRVMNGLKRGDSFLCNLTLKTPISTDLSLGEIFALSISPYALYVPDHFVCFSPEKFVHISQGRISTHPMKGTINANIPNAETLILENQKETAEHYTIVDLMRNDLGMVAEQVEVRRFRYIDKICSRQNSILQVSSEISAQLVRKDFAFLGDILFALLPAGSVSGAPKRSTLELIRKAEKEARAYYTGVFAYFDGESLDSAVMIRFIEEKEGKKYFRSGGGITVFSDMESEYKEVIEKIYLPFV